MCPWLLRKPSRPSLILTKFLGKKLQFNLDRFRLSNFLPIPVLLQKARFFLKIMFFSVSLELRCVLGFWENYPDRLWFWPNFLERNFNLIWTVSDFQSFYRFQFCSKKPKKDQEKYFFLVFHWNWDVSLASEKATPTVFDLCQISWKEASI